MIEGGFDRLSGNRPFVLVDLRIDRLNVRWTSIRALIDTGAVYSAVHADVALSTLGIERAELEVDNWPALETTQLGGVGGSLHYRRLPAAFRFTHGDGELLEVDAELHIGEYLDEAGEKEGESNALPSLLGWDILNYFRLTLDRGTHVATLEPLASAEDAASPQ